MESSPIIFFQGVIMTERHYDVSRSALNISEKPKKKVEPITHGTRKKKSKIERASEEFLGDNPRSLGNDIVDDIVIPSIKNMISDLVHTIGDVLTGGADRMLYGQTDVGVGSRYSRVGSTKVSYDRVRNGTRASSALRGAPPEASHRMDQVIVNSRVVAESILQQMYDLLQQYGTVTVSDFYNMVDITPTHVDEEWGWTDLKGSMVRQVRDGFEVALVPPMPI